MCFISVTEYYTAAHIAIVLLVKSLALIDYYTMTCTYNTTYVLVI